MFFPLKIKIFSLNRTATGLDLIPAAPQNFEIFWSYLLRDTSTTVIMFLVACNVAINYNACKLAHSGGKLSCSEHGFRFAFQIIHIISRCGIMFY